ncbi:sigma-70 family RNA polymerase sigma factor [Oceanobacillus kimchii]|uniref:sigma-70 family RNA polymerase sigma factor n=1 Tax=Oceanobacillus kimchii TaxID=746691 RepID=UPI003C70BEC7
MVNPIYKKLFRQEVSNLTNTKALNNTLVKSFFKEGENTKIFNQFMQNPTKDNQILLDKSFQEYYTKVKMVNYLSKTIYWKSVDYDKKIKFSKDRALPLIDENGNEHSQLFEQQPIDSVENQVIESYNLPLAEKIENQILKEAFENLTDRQKEVIQNVYGYEKNINETAYEMCISQQAVSKIHKNAIANLREKLLKGCESYD